MVRAEITDQRSRWWSHWHRQTLPRQCYMSDLDSAEWRPGRGIVAFIEVKQPGDSLTEWQEQRFLPALATLGPPVFLIVVPGHDAQIFTIWRIHADGTMQDVGVFTEDEFTAWMVKL